MHFVELMAEFKNDLGPKINASIKGLLNKKTRSEEISLGPRIDILNKFIEQRLAYFENLNNSLKPAPREYDKLDRFFRTTLSRFEKH
jgi:predicted nucleotidyltransferase